MTWEQLKAEAESLAEIKNFAAKQRIADTDGAVAVAEEAGLVARTSSKFASSAAARASGSAPAVAEEKSGRRGGKSRLPSMSPPAGSRRGGGGGRGGGRVSGVKLEARESPPPGKSRTIKLNVGDSDSTKELDLVLILYGFSQKSKIAGARFFIVTIACCF